MSGRKKQRPETFPRARTPTEAVNRILSDRPGQSLTRKKGPQHPGSIPKREQEDLGGLFVIAGDPLACVSCGYYLGNLKQPRFTPVFGLRDDGQTL